MPLLLCLRIRKGQYIIPLMHCLSARKGQYYVPLIFAAFPHVFHKRDNNMPLLYAFLFISGIIYCPLYAQFPPTFPFAYSPKGTIYCPSRQNKAKQKGQLIVPFKKRFPTNAPYIVPFICRFCPKRLHHGIE